MTNIQNLSSSQLRKMVAIREQIEQLEAELNAFTNGDSAPVTSMTMARRSPGRPKGNGRRKMSSAAKARIGAAQRARWAKVRAETGTAADESAPKRKGKRRKVSATVRAKLAAIAKARWAKAKASGKMAL